MKSQIDLRDEEKIIMLFGLIDLGG